MRSSTKGHIASLIFAVRTSQDETCLVQADQAELMDCGAVRFLLNNESKSTVAVFKRFDYFFIEGINE